MRVIAIRIFSLTSFAKEEDTTANESYANGRIKLSGATALYTKAPQVDVRLALTAPEHQALSELIIRICQRVLTEDDDA